MGKKSTVADSVGFCSPGIGRQRGFAGDSSETHRRWDLHRRRQTEAEVGRVAMGIRLADLSADLREHYEERAAIIEFDAGMPRRAAESMALQDVLVIQERLPMPVVDDVRA
ncbi:MAG TPA: hypothetical protein PLC86_00460 [Candidatus Accumulibacter phosphatis]|nr:hypothetical protein [Candidatus Accumulibacter phosphatis]